MRTTEFPGIGITTTNTHGTGCSLSSALAARYARPGQWVEAVAESKRWLTESIRHGAALEVGTGHGPISHFAGPWERGGTTTRPTPDEVKSNWWEHIRSIRQKIDNLPLVRRLGGGHSRANQHGTGHLSALRQQRDRRGVAASRELDPDHGDARDAAERHDN